MTISEVWTQPATILLMEPPYQSLRPLTDRRTAAAPFPYGEVVLWRLAKESHEHDLERISNLPPGLPWVVLLPPPDNLAEIAETLWKLPTLKPRAALPFVDIDVGATVRSILVTPPVKLGATIAAYLADRGLNLDSNLQSDVARVIELAPDVHSVSELARRMFASRRTLGRRFSRGGLPVPSHVLQFARLLHVALTIQQESIALFRIACRYGYPDGFTMSNQMKRLIGCRPSEVRTRLGWEWIVERWLAQERL